MPRLNFFRRKSPGVFRRVIDLRRKECSYSEIRKETGLAKSTIQNWLTYAGLTLTKRHLEIQAKNRAIAHVIATAASKVTRARRKNDEIDSFMQDIKKYFSDPFFVTGMMLYEAEGSKGENNGFSNSDFRLVLVYVRFIEKYFALDRNENMRFRLYVHDSRKKDLVRIKHFWSHKLSISPNMFKVSWKHNIVSEARFNLDYEGQMNVGIRGIKNFTGKMSGVSDIILKKYQRI